MRRKSSRAAIRVSLASKGRLDDVARLRECGVTGTDIAFRRPNELLTLIVLTEFHAGQIRRRHSTSVAGLGCVKTQACCGAVEWRSQASDLLSFSREARLLAPSDAEAQKSRKLRG